MQTQGVPPPPAVDRSPKAGYVYFHTAIHPSPAQTPQQSPDSQRNPPHDIPAPSPSGSRTPSGTHQRNRLFDMKAIPQVPPELRKHAATPTNQSSTPPYFRDGEEEKKQLYTALADIALAHEQNTARTPSTDGGSTRPANAEATLVPEPPATRPPPASTPRNSRTPISFLTQQAIQKGTPATPAADSSARPSTPPPSGPMQTPPSHRLAQTEHHRRTVAHPGAGETNPFPPAPAPQVGTPLLLPQQREAVRQQQQQIAMLTQTQSPRIRLEQSPPSPRSPAEDKPEAARHIENLLLSLPVMPPSTPYGAGPALSPPRSFCTPHASPLPQPAKAKGAARPEADSGDEYEEEMRAHQQQRHVAA
ncbi:hypothetical protein PAPYR_10954 [Paratrimastix pyriformis]|uniref:Uncharacterized protein n=1 Tax=Paratrimastix pyriformis TaxID=342808 RepID=A0ABQ8U9T8_9EUKA|nr:hypothetical protein PAPYR_10954 [Paratrimastix pyriformis]